MLVVIRKEKWGFIQPKIVIIAAELKAEVVFCFYRRHGIQLLI